MTLAASEQGVFGAMGAGGIALALTVVLVLGVKGKGKLKLRDGQAWTVAFLAGTAYQAAGDIWTNAEEITAQGLTGLGVGGGNSPFGDVGIGAACLILLAIALFAPLNPAGAATLGMVSGLVWPLAGEGSIWDLPVELGAAALMMIGGG